MVEFRAVTPFPLLELSDLAPSEVRTHSVAVDRWLGLRTTEVEAQLAQRGSKRKASNTSGEKQELWFGLDPQLLLTPYLEIRSLLEHLQPLAGQTVIDLGAAYGRMAFVLARHFPGVRFKGYEYVGERVDEGKRILLCQNLDPASLEQCDLAAPSFRPIEAEIYFIYDFGTPKAIEKALYDLQKIARDREVTVVGRGRHCRSLIASRHPWLAPRASPRGDGRTTIYKTLRKFALNDLR